MWSHIAKYMFLGSGFYFSHQKWYFASRRPSEAYLEAAGGWSWSFIELINQHMIQAQGGILEAKYYFWGEKWNSLPIKHISRLQLAFRLNDGYYTKKYKLKIKNTTFNVFTWKSGVGHPGAASRLSKSIFLSIICNIPSFWYFDQFSVRSYY